MGITKVLERVFAATNFASLLLACCAFWFMVSELRFRGVKVQTAALSQANALLVDAVYALNITDIQKFGGSIYLIPAAVNVPLFVNMACAFLGLIAFAGMLVEILMIVKIDDFRGLHFLLPRVVSYLFLSLCTFGASASLGVSAGALLMVSSIATLVVGLMTCGDADGYNGI